MIKLTIDGKKLEAQKSQTILQIAQEAEIHIPTLCYHEALESYGACRLCVVEVKKGKRTRIVTSCNYPAENGIVVKTNSEKVLNVRRLVVELLLARCPNVKAIKDLSLELGIGEPRFKKDNNFCILCGLCVRVCREVVGAEAIGFANRGVTREVTPPFLDPAKQCIGCGSCVYICPTGIITMSDEENAKFYYPGGHYEMGCQRIMHNWKQTFRMAECKTCGRPFMPQAQIEFMVEKYNIPREEIEVCKTCSP
jgi:NADH dehydrogenase/NADH:ubiquinone oxidoreductase subunit G